MSETVAQCIERVRLLISGRNRTTLNRLQGAISTSDTTLTCEFPLNRITQFIHICVGLEIMHVWSIDQTAKTVVVERAQLGSSAAAHADNDLVEVSPRFSRWAIYKAIIDEIRSWPTSIYETVTWQMDETSGIDSVSIPNSFSDAYGVIDVFKSPRAGEEKWRRMSTVRLIKDLPNGLLMLNLGEEVNLDTTYQVTFARPFDLSSFALTVDLVDDVGMSDSLLDAIAYGVAARLLVPLEVDRLLMDAQGLPRLAEETAQQAAMQIGVGYLQFRNQRLADESYRLIREHPLRFGI